MNWNKLTFKKFITLQRGFDLPVAEMKDGEIPVLGSTGIIGYHNKAKVNAPGVVTGRSGTIGVIQYINKPYWPHNTSLWVKNFRSNHPKFVYYKMKTLNFERFNGGASVPTLNRNNLDNITVQIPDTLIQEAIADVLSTYDDLIDTNRRRIQLLEEAARLLFREWFVYFRFPGHEKVKIVDSMPEGWKRENIGKIGYLNYGKSLVEETREEGDVKVYGSSGVVGVHSKSLVEGPGIIVGRKGNVGAIHWVNDSYWPIDTVYYIKREQSNLFLYLSLKTIGFINTDVSVPGLNRDYAHSKTILVPVKDLLGKFLNQVNDIYNMVKILSIQNQRLAQARDLLLPRLMSGAIDPIRYDKLSNGVEV